VYNCFIIISVPFSAAWLYMRHNIWILLS